MKYIFRGHIIFEYKPDDKEDLSEEEIEIFYDNL